MRCGRITRVWAIGLMLSLVLAGGHGARVGAAQDGDVARRQDAIASLVVTAGSAELTSGDQPALDLGTGDFAEVRSGDVIAVSEDGEAILTFFEGIETRLAAGTELTVDAVESGDAPDHMRLDVSAGQVFNNVATIADAQSRFEVLTPSAAISVRGTQFLVFVRPNALTQVATLEGVVAVSAQDQSVEVPCGYGLKVVPGETPGTVNVWGQMRLTVTAPVEGAERLPVTLINTESVQHFFYRADDLMTAVIGSYDVFVNSPGPYRTEVTFPEDTEAETPVMLEAELGGVAVSVVDDAGEPVDDFGDLVITLTQDDLAGQTTVASGEPFAAGPGEWGLEITPVAQPGTMVSLKVDVSAGEISDVTIPQSMISRQKK